MQYHSSQLRLFVQTTVLDHTGPLVWLYICIVSVTDMSKIQTGCHSAALTLQFLDEDSSFVDECHTTLTVKLQFSFVYFFHGWLQTNKIP